MDLRILLISVILLSFFDFCVQDSSNGNNANNNSQNNNNNNYNDNTNNNCSNAKNDKSNNGNKNNNNNNSGNNNNGNQNNNNNNNNGNNNNGNQNNNNNNNGNSNCSSSDNNDDGNNSNSTTINDDDSDNSSDNTDVDTTIRAKENTASDDDTDDTSVTKPTPNNNNTSASVSAKSAATSPFTTKPTATVSNLASLSTEHTDDLTSAKNVTEPTIHSVTPPLSIENTSGLMPANNVTEATSLSSLPPTTAEHTVGLTSANNVTESTSLSNLSPTTAEHTVGLTSANNVTQATTLSNLPPTTAEHTVGLTSANNVTQATTLSNLSPTTAEHTFGLTSANNVTEATTLSNLSPTSTDHTVGPALVTNATERDKQSMSRKTNRGPTDTGTEARTGQPYMTHEPGQVITNIGLNGVTISYVGGNGCMHCIITVSDSNQVITVSWYRGNAQILQTPNSRFTMDKNGTDFTLYIENVTRRDDGDYSCRAQVNGEERFTQSLPFPFKVIDYPEISIRPLTLTVSKGGSRAKFTCRITNEDLIDQDSFDWMVNNKTVSANQSEFVVSKISNVEEQMEFEPDSENGFVTCSFINATATAQYHVLNNTEVKSCPEETDQNGIRWTSVLAGSTVLADCPMYQSGEASRRCGYNGLWAESANLIDCVSLDLIQLEWKVDDKIDGVVEDGVTFGTLLEELRNVTWEEIQRSNRNLLGAGNLDKTVDLLEKISDHQNNTTEEEVQVFADIVDSVLGLKEDEEWERITTRSRSKPAVILESVQRTGASAGMQLPTNASLSIKRTNIELYISKMAADQTLVFPSGSNEKNSYFVLSENSLLAISDAQTRSPANADNMSVVMTATRYTTISSFMPATLENNTGSLVGNSSYFVNTEVLSLSFGDGQVPINLTDPIVLYFKHINVNASDPICSFWNFDSKTPGGAWSGAGCDLDILLSNRTHTVCLCDHLTNFAVLMSVSPYTPSPKDEAVLEVITLVGCSLSIIGCLLTIAVYIRLWRYVKSARYHLLLQLCSSLVIVYVIFLAGINKTDNEALCTAVALLLHFFLLVAFFLMLAMGIEIAINVTYVFATRSKLIYLVLIGWVVPFVIVVIAASVTGLEGYGGRSCWLSVDNGLIYAFVGPAILVIIANSVILWVVLRAVYSTSIMITKNTLEKAKTGARSMCVLMPVMGITWVFGMLTVNEWLVFFQYIFAICNCLQGVFIFVMYCLLNSSVREGIQRVRHKHKASTSYSSDDSKQRKSAVSKKTLLGFGTSFGNHSPEGSNSVNNKPSQLKSSNENIVDPTMDINLTPLPLGLENNAVQE